MFDIEGSMRIVHGTGEEMVAMVYWVGGWPVADGGVASACALCTASLDGTATGWPPATHGRTLGLCAFTRLANPIADAAPGRVVLQERAVPRRVQRGGHRLPGGTPLLHRPAGDSAQVGWQQRAGARSVTRLVPRSASRVTGRVGEPALSIERTGTGCRAGRPASSCGAEWSHIVQGCTSRPGRNASGARTGVWSCCFLPLLPSSLCSLELLLNAVIVSSVRPASPPPLPHPPTPGTTGGCCRWA